MFLPPLGSNNHREAKEPHVRLSRLVLRVCKGQEKSKIFTIYLQETQS